MNREVVQGKRKSSKNKMEPKSNTYIKKRLFSVTKRSIDILLSSVGLIISLPILLITGVCIVVDDPGPIFYSQQRVGKNGKVFRMYKLRSMYQNADKIKDKLLDKNEINGLMFKMREDPRITRVGSFIRKHSLDELPQLYNVLIGDMSVVGPRPPLLNEYEYYTEKDKQRLVVKPGCTGLWQVTGRNALDFDQMVALDLKYIRHQSLLLDLKIMFRTVKVIIFPNDAY